MTFGRTRLALAAAGLFAASHAAASDDRRRPPAIELPLPGWTSARTTHLVARVADAGTGSAALLWLGRRWPIPVSAEGLADAWLPLVPGENALAVEAGSSPEGIPQSGVKLWRSAAGGGEDMIVVAGWPASGARLDLRVTDPSGEACDASNRRSRLGGVRLRDDPEGPGPHVFVLPHAAAGEYQVSVLCGRLAPGQAVPVQLLVLLFPGTPREERYDLSGVVGRCDEDTDLGRIEVAGRIGGP